MDEKLCSERHKRVDDKLGDHEKWLKEHEDKIDILNRSDATNTQAIKELCKQIGDLVSTLKWFIGLTISSLLGFFIFAIQKGIFK